MSFCIGDTASTYKISGNLLEDKIFEEHYATLIFQLCAGTASIPYKKGNIDPLPNTVKKRKYVED